jgi:hypothetical protein
VAPELAASAPLTSLPVRQTDPNDAYERFSETLRSARLDDGSMAWVDGGAAEPEPTALLALATDDAEAREWLAAHQGEDGAVILETGEVRNTGAAALNALALPDEASRLSALAFAVAALGQTVPDPQYAGDPPGWGWVPATFAWTEPTSRVLLATRLLRPDDAPTIEDATVILRGREVVGGGWNYGNSAARGTDLTPYVQTTAIACTALQGLDEPSLDRGLSLLEARTLEELGGLSLAMSLLALRLGGRGGGEVAQSILDALVEQYERTAFLGNLGAVAWAALATAPGPSVLEVPS